MLHHLRQSNPIVRHQHPLHLPPFLIPDDLPHPPSQVLNPLPIDQPRSTHVRVVGQPIREFDGQHDGCDVKGRGRKGGGRGRRVRGELELEGRNVFVECSASDETFLVGEPGVECDGLAGRSGGSEDVVEGGEGGGESSAAKGTK